MGNDNSSNRYINDPSLGLMELDFAIGAAEANPDCSLEPDQASELRSFLATLPVPVTPLTEPYTPETAQAAAQDNVLTVVVGLSFDSVLGADIDDLNDQLSAQVTGSEVGLTDISMKPVYVDEYGTIMFEVTGDISDWLAEELDNDEDTDGEAGL